MQFDTQRGHNIELLFKLCIESQEKVYAIKTSKEVDMFDHIDFFINGKGFEVKAMKSFKRGMPVDENLIILEFQNVRGNLGWLYGKADYIVFERLNEFIIVKRKDLIEAAEYYFKDDYIYSYPAYYQKYGRKDRMDSVGYLKYKDIENIIWKVISKDVSLHKQF